MFKFILFLVIIIAVTVVALSIFSNDNTLIITLPNYEIETSLAFISALTIAALIILSTLIYSFVKTGFLIKKYRLNRNNKNYHNAISEITKTLTFIALGNSQKAKESSQKVKKYLGNAPLANLLTTQTTPQALDKPAKLKKTLQQMLLHKETKSFALKSYGVKANKKHDYLAAFEYFQQALDLEPKSINLVSLLNDAYINNNDYAAALKLLNKYI